MSKIIIKIDREKPVEFICKADANEYMEAIRKSGRYYYKISLNEYGKEIIFIHHLSSLCIEIMNYAAKLEGVLIDIKLVDGEMTTTQRIVCKLELEGLIEENELKGKQLVHRLTKKGLSFYNDYKALAWLRKRGKIKIKHDGIREKIGIYNLPSSR